MPRARDFLERFRPIGAPGAATAGGVPADRLAELTAELEPVFELLAATETECTRIRQDAEQRAQHQQAEAVQRAQARVAAAGQHAEVERAAAASRLRQEVDTQAAQTLAEAEREAARIAQVAQQRMPHQVQQVIRRVRTELLGWTETVGGGRP